MLVPGVDLDPLASMRPGRHCFQLEGRIQVERGDLRLVGKETAPDLRDDRIAQQIARRVKLPPGYRIEWAGEFESLQQGKKRLELIVPLSIGLIMVLLYALFGSVRDSVLALAGIPFAVAGGVLALWVTGLNFSISAAIGFVSLLGISVMNGILMVTYYNEIMHRGGMTSLEGMFHAGSQRMRPMLMTALSACIGLVPAAISTGIGSQVQRPLATVVVGGLLIGPLRVPLNSLRWNGAFCAE